MGASPVFIKSKNLGFPQTEKEGENICPNFMWCLVKKMTKKENGVDVKMFCFEGNKGQMWRQPTHLWQRKEKLSNSAKCDQWLTDFQGWVKLGWNCGGRQIRQWVRPALTRDAASSSSTSQNVPTRRLFLRLVKMVVTLPCAVSTVHLHRKYESQFAVYSVNRCNFLPLYNQPEIDENETRHQLRWSINFIQSFVSSHSSAECKCICRVNELSSSIGRNAWSRPLPTGLMESVNAMMGRRWT